MSGFGYNVLGFGANASSAAILPSDDQFNRVSFLSHFDGANNGVNNAFDDGSTSNHTITANGNVTQGSFGPYGTNWSVDFDGGDYFTVPQHADFNVDDGSYTMECFVNTTFSGYQNIIACWDGATSGNPGWGMFISSGNQFGMFVGTAEVGKAGAVVNDGAWHHLAGVFTNSGATVTLYVDGAQISTGSVTAPADNAASIIRIGAAGNASATSLYTGKISNLRLVKGTAVYSGSSFTVPTSALTAITNTKLLVLGRNNFSDGSASGHVLTPISDPTVTAFGPILTSSVYDPAVNGGSAYFDGSGDYLDTPTGADFELDANYTIEGWFFQTVREEGSCLFELNDYRSGILFRLGNASSIYDSWYINGTEYDEPASSFPLNQWNHFAMTRDGSTNRLFANGVQIATASVSGDINSTQGKLRIGGIQHDSGQQFDGYVGDFRLIKGTAVYTSNFTPPTAPLTAVTNTKLLLNMADGQAIDSAAQNNLTLVGNTDTSTGQAKFGNTSLFYDGSGDGAYYENGAALGTGDWTIETFLWVNDFDANLGVFQYGGADGALGSLVLTNQKIRVVSNNIAARLDTSGTINAQTWYHVAYVSYNGTIKVYINGTADSTTFDASSTTWTFTDTTVYVGARYYSSAVQAPFDGYLDEFRVSHFARYTSNFTAPTVAFPDKGQ